MGTGTPLTSITLGAASVADDLGYVALADLAQALDGLTDGYRVIGGHMVTTASDETLEDEEPTPCAAGAVP